MAWKLLGSGWGFGGGPRVELMRMNIEYMKEFVLEEVKEASGYEMLFEMFVICLRNRGKSYGQYRTEEMRRRGLQRDFWFWD